MPIILTITAKTGKAGASARRERGPWLKGGAGGDARPLPGPISRGAKNAAARPRYGHERAWEHAKPGGTAKQPLRPSDGAKRFVLE